MNLETERLVIRYFKEEDAQDLYEYLSKEEVVRYEPYDAFTYSCCVAIIVYTKEQ